MGDTCDDCGSDNIPTVTGKYTLRLKNKEENERTNSNYP